MKKYAAIVLLAIYCSCLASLVRSEASYADNAATSNHHPNTLLVDIDTEPRNDGANDANNNFEKRMERYAFGLGRRAYTYTNANGVKRLPVYNFGLGKRARPYSFGLGKRADYDDENQYDTDFERYLDEKRNRPYSFGLGKREPVEDVDRRGMPNRYGFGLGR